MYLPVPKIEFELEWEYSQIVIYHIFREYAVPHAKNNMLNNPFTCQTLAA